jgi:trimethylamine--corrinoid protein Co-methyltransferase
VVDEALSTLERHGTLIEDPHARAKLETLGLPADPETHRVRFPRATVEKALQTAPSAITLYDRDGRPYTTLEGDKVHFVPASSALRVLDRRTQEAREPKTADFVEYVKLANGLKNIDYLSTAFIPKDIPQDIADVWRLYLVLAHSRRPVVSGAFTAWGVPRMGEVMSYFRQGKDDLVQKPMAIFTCCPNTPLRWGEDPICNIVDCAEWGIPIEVVPVLLLGMISPVTTVGALVLHTAEVLSGLTIAQLVRPGAPVLFGGAPATFHMKAASSPMAAIEALHLDIAYVQVGKALGLPTQAYMALSDAKVLDAQAGAETFGSALLAALAGVNSVSGPGMLDYVLVFSLPKLVFDDEVCGQALHFVRPIEERDDLPAGELVTHLLDEAHLIMAAHTTRFWPEELWLTGPVYDRDNRETWERKGAKSLEARAVEEVDRRLAAYRPPETDPAVDAEMLSIIRAGMESPADLPEVPPPPEPSAEEPTGGRRGNRRRARPGGGS